MSNRDDVIEDVWSMLADLHDKVDALGTMLAKRDRVNVELVKHTERLVREKEELLRYIGIADLVRRANAADVPVLSAPGEAAQPRLRELAERLGKLKGCAQ